MKIEGLAELNKALLELPKELHQGPLRAAVSAGAKVVQDEARRRAPVDTGTTRQAIYRTRSREGSSAVQEMAIVSIRHGKRFQRRGLDAWYWFMNEFGTSRQPARPFLRPAFDTTIPKQIEALREHLAKAIERAAEKLKWSNKKS